MTAYIGIMISICYLIGLLFKISFQKVAESTILILFLMSSLRQILLNYVPSVKLSGLSKPGYCLTICHIL